MIMMNQEMRLWTCEGSRSRSPLFSVDFPGGSVVRNLPANAGDEGLIPGLGRSPDGRNGNTLQYSCLGNPMDREAELARGYSPNGCKECDC